MEKIQKIVNAVIQAVKQLFIKNSSNVAVYNQASASTEENRPSEEPTNNIDEIHTAMTSNVKILIDNGHGNNTAGKRSPWSSNKVEPEIDFYEYKWNREIASPIVEGLKSLGYDAELLVTEITDVSLKERVNRINKICSEKGAGNVIIVSIHANAAGNGTAWMNGKGWSAYTTKGTTKSDKLAECLYEEASKNFVDRKIRKDTTDGDSDEEANFYIIKNANCPAVLTENFFYDNIDDVKYILSDEGRKAVIKTHIDGIIKFIKILGK